jgi:hypothetical protein
VRFGFVVLLPLQRCNHLIAFAPSCGVALQRERDERAAKKTARAEQLRREKADRTAEAEAKRKEREAARSARAAEIQARKLVQQSRLSGASVLACLCAD